MYLGVLRFPPRETAPLLGVPRKCALEVSKSGLWVALGAGAVFSVGRMMQGAHFLSHNLWTLLFDWTICVLCYRWVLYRRPVEAPERSVFPRDE